MTDVVRSIGMSLKVLFIGMFKKAISIGMSMKVVCIGMFKKAICIDMSMKAVCWYVHEAV